MSKTIITILGSGDTLGTPIAKCKLPACLDINPKSKRYRFGILIEHQNKKILIDANPDLKWQCINNDFELKDIDYVLVTHTHSDHINGMGEFFFRNHQPTTVYYPNHPISKKNISYFNYLEMEGVLQFVPYDKNTFELGDIKVQPIELNHGFPCFGFVLYINDKKVTIISDTCSSLCPETINLIKNSDILFLDAFSEDFDQVKQLYDSCNEKLPNNISEAWKHMTIAQTKELHKSSSSKLTYTIHMSRFMAPHNELMTKYQTDNFIIGYDGLVIPIL